MFQSVEKHQTLAKIVLACISIGLVGFGAYSFSDVINSAQPLSGNNIVSIGNTEITENDISQIMQSQNMEDSDELKQEIFKNLVKNAYLIEGAKKMGFNVSDEELKKSLTKIIHDAPIFKDESGAFKKEKFDDFLKEQGMTEELFVKNAIAADSKQAYIQQIVSLFFKGQLVTDQQIDRFLQLNMTAKKAHVYSMDMTKYLEQVKPTDAQLQAYYDKNKVKFEVPDRAKFDFIIVSTKDPRYASQLVVNDSEITEERNASHILIKVSPMATEKEKLAAKKKAEGILAEVKAKPEAFSELATKYSEDPGSAKNGGQLGFFARGAMVPAFDQKAFSLKKGEISDLVESNFGYHIIKLLDIKHIDNLSTEEKKELQEALKAQKTQVLLAEKVRELQKFTKKDASEFEKAKKELDFHSQQTPQAFSEEEMMTMMPKEIVSSLFTDDILKNKKISPVLQADDTAIIAIATEYKARHIPVFNDIKEIVTQNYKYQEALTLAEKDAKDLLSKLNKGEKLDLKWTPEAESLTPERMGTLPPELTRAIMVAANPSEDKPKYVMGTLPAGVLLFKIIGEDKVTPEMAKEYSGQIRQQLGQMTADYNVAIFLKLLSTQFKEVPGSQPSPLMKATGKALPGKK